MTTRSFSWILAEAIQDQRFLRLIRNMMKAGYLEDWEDHYTLSGVPQGGTVSPILSNIYLHKLEESAPLSGKLIPQYTRGAFRKGKPRVLEGKSTAESRAEARGPGGGPRIWKSSCARSRQSTRWTPVTAASST